MSERIRRLGGYLWALVAVLASGAVAEALYRLLDITRLSPIFLAGVLIVAVTHGSGPAYFAAFLAFGIYNFYLAEPRFTLGFDSEDVLILMMFMAVAMLTGSLAGRVRDQAQRAQGRARTAGALFDATRAFSSLNEETVIRQELLTHVSRAARGAAILMDGERTFHHPEGAPPSPDLLIRLRHAAASGISPSAPGVDDWRVRRLEAQSEVLGVLAWRTTEKSPLGADDDILIEVLIEVGVAAISRARLAQVQAEVQALSQAERLRTALLSSISHDLRTPLASILASASSLREFGERFDPNVRDDLVLTIQEEAERLNTFVANLLQMTKLEGGGLAVDSSRFDVREVLDRVARRYARRSGQRRLAQTHADGELVAVGDPILLEQALGNVVENAIRFSPDGSEIRLSARRSDGETVIEVADDGPGVPAGDLRRIFDKFYRSPASAQNLQGTGLGLSIVKGLVEAMGGTVAARSGARDDRGLTVTLSLPSEVA